MKLQFTSYTVEGKPGEELAEIHMDMESVLNDRLSSRTYGPGVQEWFLMFIMVPPHAAAADDPERVRFLKRDKAFDLRLHLSFDAFQKADKAGRKALVAQTMLRSLDLIAARKVPGFDAAALKADVEAIAREQGWVG